MTLCGKGLHDKDLPGGRLSNGGCRACRDAWLSTERGRTSLRTAMQRYGATGLGRSARRRANTKYLQTEKGVVAARRAKRRWARWTGTLRTMNHRVDRQLAELEIQHEDS